MSAHNTYQSLNYFLNQVHAHKDKMAMPEEIVAPLIQSKIALEALLGLNIEGDNNEREV